MIETAYTADALPDGIRMGRIDNGNGLQMNVLEAGEAGRPCVLLLHGFPELAYSWRKIMPVLAEAGYHAVAPDQRGYGLTTGWDPSYDGDLGSYRILNLVRDVLGLLAALEVPHVHGVAGHDFGSYVTGFCALARPDIFHRTVFMSAPFTAPAPLPTGGAPAAPDMEADLAALPRPRKHYQRYYSTREANDDMWRCEQGVHDFLRAYFHMKSADWTANAPTPLDAWRAEELAKLPTYYVMDLDQDMAATVAAEMPPPEVISANTWLPDDDLRVYATTFEATGFQGGLNWYRCKFVDDFLREQQLFAGRTIDQPTCFISGKSDWGVHQTPGALEAMKTTTCTNMRGCHLIDGAGHWVQQEHPDDVAHRLLEFFQNN